MVLQIDRPDWYPQRVWDEASNEALKYVEWLVPTPTDSDAEHVLTVSFARAILAAEQRERGNAVGVGMVIAAGIIMSCWGDEVQAEEILNASGLTTIAAMKAAGVDQYDIDLCKPVLRTLREHKRLKAGRAIRNRSQDQ